MKASFFLACLLPALSPVQGQNATPIQPWHGEKSTVPAGVEVALQLPQKVKLGDSIRGTFSVKNVSDVPFEISTGASLSLKIRVTDSTGNRLPDELGDLPLQGGSAPPRVLQPGDSVKIELLPLFDYSTFPGVGVFTVEARHDLGWIVDDKHPQPVATATVEIVMPTAEEVSARVHDLCVGSDFALQSELATLKHEIFLPALLDEARAGHANAITGIVGMRGVNTTKLLLDLLRSPSSDVVKASGRELIHCLPDLGHPESLTFASWNDGTPHLKDWDPELREPLLTAALAMLRSKDPAIVELGAAMIQAQGDATQAKPLLDAMQTALEGPWEIRFGKGSNTLDAPPPLRGIIQAIDALRSRGWRLGTDAGGGSAVMLTQFRELADPSIQRPANDRWKQTLLAFIDANPPTFRQNAILAIPTPVPAEFEPALMKALDDKDWGVLRSACEVAGKSKRKSFIPPLCHIVETTHETFVQASASNAALVLGARVELWEAWCEVITDQEFMSEALRQLALGTLDISSGSSAGNSNFSREQRFAIRDEWRKFIRTNHDRLAHGERVPINDPSVSPVLTGSNFDAGNPAIFFSLPDRKTWPVLKREVRR